MALRFIPLLACVLSCAAGPSIRRPEADPVPRACPASRPNVAIRLAFDTGFSWWTDPNAGCSPDWLGDPAQKCQAAIRKCSPGCDVCRNLEPGEGPDAVFRSLRQLPGRPAYARTGGPYLFGGFDTRFDPKLACHDATLLAKVMVHESTHACIGAGGSNTLYDHNDIFERGTPGCYADEIAPFEGNRQCGDPL